jgi:hypothetical protein
MRKHLLPALTLFLLSPLIGELVSGSSPPANWLHPMTFLLVVPLYGSGAVLARELWGGSGSGVYPVVFRVNLVFLVGNPRLLRPPRSAHRRGLAMINPDFFRSLIWQN